ncbi:hypothetical protein GCM10027615_28150 [Plantactinospora veratri]
MTSPIRLAPGDAAPDFALPTDTGETLSLKELRGRKVVLYAYPKAMTPGCTKQACDFRDSLASLQAAGYEVVGISPDSPPRWRSSASGTPSPSRWSPTGTRRCSSRTGRTARSSPTGGRSPE